MKLIIGIKIAKDGLMSAPLPNNEEERLAVLLDYDILDTASEQIFDSITVLASQICNIPISLIVFIDRNRQWFKSKHGVPEELKDIQETPRDIAFCAHTILGTELLEVNDLTKDERFAENPFVKQFPNIRYYAGIPLATKDGINIGSLCVLDQEPRQLTDKQKSALINLSTIVSTLIDARKNVSEVTLLGQALETSFNQIYLFRSGTLKCIYANKSALQAVSVDTQNPFNFSLHDTFTTYSQTEFEKFCEPLYSREKLFLVVDSFQKKPSGQITPVELRVQVSFSKSYPIIIVVATDISERKLIEQKILELNASLEKRVTERTFEVNNSLAVIKATLESTTDAILVLDNNKQVIECNQKYLEFFSQRENVKDMGMPFLLQQLTSPEIFSIKLEAIERQPYQKSFDEVKFKNGRFIELHSQPQILDQTIIGRVWCLRDITTQKILQDQLIHKATHDLLTDIPNRLLIEDRIKHSISFANESKTLFALLFIDLDRFKNVNDMYGHPVGDALLKEVAVRLKTKLRPTDSVARMGGDEFIVVLSPLKSIDEVGLIVQGIQNKLAEPYLINNLDIKISSSVGISIYPKDAEEVDKLLKNADVAMFRSKESRNNAAHFYTEEMNKYSMKLLELENFLSMAIENNELILNYQPLLCLKTGKVIGVEALIRWSHPKLGMVPPMDFIPIAESTGTILPIGEWVLRTACNQLKTWHDLGFNEISVAVNVSSQQFKHPQFYELIKTIIDETGIDPAYLCIELTESLMLDNIDAIIVKMDSLKKLGIGLVIDDFGTGYSSLSYLTKLPIEKLKIDRSFLNSIQSDTRDMAIVLAIIEMGKSLKLKVLAEGVENQGQLNFLIKNNCDEIQGFLLSRPLDIQDCEIFFKKNFNGSDLIISSA